MPCAQDYLANLHEATQIREHEIQCQQLHHLRHPLSYMGASAVQAQISPRQSNNTSKKMQPRVGGIRLRR